jgi:lipopolysaccharide export system permease protein
MPILSRYVVKEILSHLAGVLAIILGIFLIQRFASLLADATEGSFPLSAISSLLALRTVMALPSLLPVTLYLAVLLALGRLYQDREMEAVSACGVRPSRIYAAVLTFAALVAVLNGMLSFSMRPWAATRFQSVRHAAMRESKIADVRPRRFYAFEDGDETVIFANARSEQDPQALRDVFVQFRHGDKISVLTAESAREQRDEVHGYRFLHLFNGNRYDLDANGTAGEVTEYRELSIRAPLGGEGTLPEKRETRSAAALSASADPKDAAELQWRIGNAVSVWLLALLAIPLSRSNPRQGKYAKLFVAILLYLAYRSLLDTARHWIEDGILPTFPGLWLVHALCFVVALAAFALNAETSDAGCGAGGAKPPADRR